MCVLIVEDEPLLRDITSEYLINQGFDVLTARNGAEAYDLIDHPPKRFSILLTDLNMPGPHNGCDIAHRMRQAHPHVHVFIVTGRPDLIRDACGSEGNYPVIPKPFDLAKLSRRFAGL